MAAKHAAEAEAEPVIEAERRTVEHLPEPDERLADGIALGIDVAVVLGFEGGVAGIEGFEQSVGGEFARERGLLAAAVGLAEIHLDEFVADDLGTAVDARVASELVVEVARASGDMRISASGVGLEFAIG